jgi:hypothetical protein
MDQLSRIVPGVREFAQGVRLSLVERSVLVCFDRDLRLVVGSRMMKTSDNA